MEYRRLIRESNKNAEYDICKINNKLTGVYKDDELRLILKNKENAIKIVEILRQDEQDKC